MQDQNWSDISNQYIEKGISVIPVNGKVPQLENWPRWCSELPEKPVLVRGQTGVGACLGPASNLVAVDIDTDDPKILNLVPPSPVVRRGKKGEVRFFQYSKDIVSRTYQAWGIEILSIGRQVVLPPSIHPETKKPYIWTQNNLLDFDLDHLPHLDLSFIQNFNAVEPLVHTTIAGRHNKLKDIACAILTRGEPVEFAAKEIYLHDKEFHNPRWFTDQTDKWKAKNEAEAQRYATQFATEISLSLLRQHVTDPILDMESLTGEKENTLEYKTFEIKSYPEPQGLLKDICELIIESSYTEVPNMALGSAISIFSVILGNRYSFEDVKSNAFCLLLAESGAGKKFGISVARSLLGDLGLIGSADYLSSQAISSSLSDHCVRLDVSDEFSKILKLVKDGNAWQAAIPQDLCRLWSASVDGFDKPVVKADGGKEKKDKEDSSRIHNPFISILSATTLAEFRESIGKGAFTSGFMPRFLLFMDKQSPHIKVRLNQHKIAELKKTCLRFIDQFLRAGKAAEDMLGASASIEYSIHSEAIDMFDSQMVSYYMESLAEEAESMKSMLNRAREYYKKLALIHSASRLDKDAKITKEDLVWAAKIIETSLHNSRQFVAEAGSENLQHSQKERIYGMILTMPGITKNILTRKTQFLNGDKHRQNIIQDLLEAKRISYRDVKTKSGKIVKSYFAVDDVKNE